MKPEQLKRLRAEILHLNQRELSEVTGACVATISRWEKGGTSPIGMARTIMNAVQQAVVNHGEERVRGIDWSHILKQEDGLLLVLRGILSFATTIPNRPPE